MILNEKCTDLRDMVRSFVDKAIIPNIAQYETAGEFPYALNDKVI